MNKTIAVCCLICAFTVMVCVAAYAPAWLNDENTFLRDFVNYNLLSVLGVILAITLASASQIHLKFNELEERIGKVFLTSSRREVISNTYWLIGLFVAGIAAVVVKPIFGVHHFGIAIINGISLLILLFNILILFDMVNAVFSIPAQLHGAPKHDAKQVTLTQRSGDKPPGS